MYGWTLSMQNGILVESLVIATKDLRIYAYPDLEFF
jgi:hypothetical protein